MIKLSENNILVSEKIADTTVVIVFNDEEIILTEINIKDFGHKINEPIGEVNVWWIKYLIDYDYFMEQLTRKILFEKTKNFNGFFMHYHYDFYEPIDIIGKGNEVSGYDELFSIIEKGGGTYKPETTLLLKRRNK